MSGLLQGVVDHDVIDRLIVFIGAGIYFIPTMIAGSRNTVHKLAIIALNLLLGWTLFGWVGALLLAIADDKQPRTAAMTTALTLR